VVGSALAAGLRHPFGPLAPGILLATGAATVGATVTQSLLQRRHAAGSEGPRSPPGTDPAREGDPCRHCAGTGLRSPTGPDRPEPPFHPTGSRALVTSWTSAGDQIWSTWLRTDTGHLPVELVGPVPATAYMPPRPGQFVPFPEKEPTLVLPARTVDPAPLRDATPGTLMPFPEEELDRLFPPDLPESDPAPESIASSFDVPGDAGFGSPFGIPPALGSPAFDVHFEAITPIPPHLRRTAPPAASPAPAPRSMGPRRSSAGPKSECTSCDRELVDLRSWGPCPECLRPVCNHCLLESLWEHGRGYCVPCAEELA